MLWKMGDSDFSTLPEVVWVQIMCHLDIADRYRVSCTCHALNQIFYHPTVWSKAAICMLSEERLKKLLPVAVTKRPLQLVRRFGSYFQDLTLRLIGFVRTIPSECLSVLEELSKNHRLEKLTLEVGSNSAHVSRRGINALEPGHDDLTAFAPVVRNATCLKSFTLAFWPRFANGQTIDILEELMNNLRLSNLEELSMYWLNPAEGTWTLNNIPLPSSSQVRRLVQHFSNLSVLRLRSVMLDDYVIGALAQANRQTLQHLSILVTYTREEKNTSIKTVSSEAWQRLQKSSPNIQVDFVIMTQVPHNELAALLKPEIPLTAICFMRHSRCLDSTIASLTDKYKATLRKFVDYTENSGCDLSILNMAEECQYLNCLIYNGALKHTTVLNLAQVKGKQWLKFGVNIDNVITIVPELGYYNDEDDDIILKLTNEGQYSTPIMRNYESEEDHFQTIESLTENLSQLLGHRWQPFTQKLFA